MNLQTLKDVLISLPWDKPYGPTKEAIANVTDHAYELSDAIGEATESFIDEAFSLRPILKRYEEDPEMDGAKERADRAWGLLRKALEDIG